MIRRIDWLAGAAVTGVWVMTIWLTAMCIQWQDFGAWFALLAQTGYALTITAFVLYFGLRFRRWEKEESADG